MQLGGKTKSNDIFAAIGNQEGVVVPESLSSAAPIIQPISPTSPLAQQHAAGLPTAAASAASTLPVHIVVDEKLSASLNRDGGLESMEVKGELMLRVSDAEKARLFIDLQPVTDSNVQFKV